MFSLFLKSSSAAGHTRRHPAVDDDFVICQNALVLVLPSRHLVRPAVDNDSVICRNYQVDV